eukprot:6206388-Pleurochrysis_carterae.AAC.1
MLCGRTLVAAYERAMRVCIVRAEGVFTQCVHRVNAHRACTQGFAYRACRISWYVYPSAVSGDCSCSSRPLMATASPAKRALVCAQTLQPRARVLSRGQARASFEGEQALFAPTERTPAWTRLAHSAIITPRPVQ